MFELNFKLQWSETEQDGICPLLAAALPKLEAELSNCGTAFRASARRNVGLAPEKRFPRPSREYDAPIREPHSLNARQRKSRPIARRKPEPAFQLPEHRRPPVRESAGAPLRWGLESPYHRLRRSGNRSEFPRAGEAAARRAKAMAERMRSRLVQHLAQAARQDGWRVTVQ